MPEHDSHMFKAHKYFIHVSGGFDVPIISAAIQISVIQLIAIFMLAGFLFHYFQTNGYKKMVAGSILIGGILGIFLGMLFIKNIQLSNIQLLLRPVLISIISVLLGGVIAVSLKKIVNIIKRRNKEQIPENKGK